MKLPYSEGCWFSVPLRNGGFSVGVVARAAAEGKIVLCYFFGPRRATPPELGELENFTPGDAVLTIRVGDLSLINGEWAIIGRTDSWRRPAWPVPPFVRRDELSQMAWRVQYSDVDPGAVDEEHSEDYGSPLGRDAVFGSGAVEIVLTKMLSKMD